MRSGKKLDHFLKPLPDIGMKILKKICELKTTQFCMFNNLTPQNNELNHRIKSSPNG